MKRFSMLLTLAVVLVLFTVAFSEAAEKTYKMKLHTVGAETHSSTHALKDFKEYVEKESNGRLQVSLHINAVLGGDRQAIEAMQLGTLEGGIVGSSILAIFEQKFNIFEFPFLFNTHAAAQKFLNGPMGDYLDKEMQKQDVRIIGWGANGFRHISNNRAPITKPDDLKGLKIRTMENPIHMETFKLLGANPTPMNFGELYTALSQKTVDAQENPVNLVYTSKFYEVQKFYSLTGHIYAVAPFAVSEIFFRSLPDDLKEIVIKGGKLYAEREVELMMTEENNMLEELKKNGMEINELTDAEKEVFKQATMPVYKQFEGRVGQELMDAALNANK